MWFLIIVGVVAVIAVGGFIASRGRYYAKMYSESNFRSYYDAVSRAVGIARAKAANTEPRLDDGTAFVTDAGLAVAITCPADGSPALHISLSQPGGHTTRAVCSHFGFFALAMFAKNKADLHAFSTESGVHHLVFRFQSQDFSIQDFAAANAMYRTEYRPIPFEFQAVGAGASVGTS